MEEGENASDLPGGHRVSIRAMRKFWNSEEVRLYNTVDPLNATELNTLKFTTMKEILIPHLHPRHVEVIGLGEAQVSQPPGKQVL